MDKILDKKLDKHFETFGGGGGGGGGAGGTPLAVTQEDCLVGVINVARMWTYSSFSVFT